MNPNYKKGDGVITFNTINEERVKINHGKLLKTANQSKSIKVKPISLNLDHSSKKKKPKKSKKKTQKANKSQNEHEEIKVEE